MGEEITIKYTIILKFICWLFKYFIHQIGAWDVEHIKRKNTHQYLSSYEAPAQHFILTQNSVTSEPSNTLSCACFRTRIIKYYARCTLSRKTKAFSAIKILHGRCVNVTMFTSIRTVRPSLQTLPQKSQRSTAVRPDLLRRISLKSDKECESYRCSFTPISNLQISMHRFPLNSQPLNKFLWKSPAPNFIQIRNKCTK